MRKISIWGKNNPGKARVIIAISYLVLVMIAIALGLLGYVNDIRVSYGMMTGIILAFFILYLFYPIRKCRWIIFRHSYVRQKSHDFLLAFTTLLLFGGLTNQFAYEPLPVEARQPLVKPVVHRIQEKQDVQMTKTMKKSARESLKIQVKNIRHQVKEWKRDNKDTDSTGLTLLKIFLALLTIAAAAGAVTGIGALSCTLSCSGNEGAAVLLIVVGIPSVVLLLILGIRGIAKIGSRKGSDVPLVKYSEVDSN